MTDLLERMRAKLQHGKDHRQLAVPIDLDDLEALCDLAIPKVIELEDGTTATDRAVLAPPASAPFALVCDHCGYTPITTTQLAECCTHCGVGFYRIAW